MKKPRTYREAGVDVAAGRRFVQAIGPMARLTRRSGQNGSIGGFGGSFDLGGRAGLLVASADGVGSKLCLAHRVGWYTPLGIDLVAMNVNDLICTGAQPLFFLDYIAAGRLKKKVLMDVVRGMVRGCCDAGCTLLGGETAEMPLLYKPEEFDLAGFAVGQVARNRFLSGASILKGDVLLGLASSGPHSNGYTLIQKVFSAQALKKRGRALLKPTRIYVRPILNLLKGRYSIHGIAHITGGSFQEKIPRILPKGLTARLDRACWPVPEIFKAIQAQGIAPAQMYQTFNMGIGMVVVLPASQVQAAQRSLSRGQVQSWKMGQIVSGKGGVTWG